MKLIKSKSFESIEKNDVLYLGDRAEPGLLHGGSAVSLHSSNRSSVGKLSIRRRRKNHNRSATME